MQSFANKLSWDFSTNDVLQLAVDNERNHYDFPIGQQDLAHRPSEWEYMPLPQLSFEFVV